MVHDFFLLKLVGLIKYSNVAIPLWLAERPGTSIGYACYLSQNRHSSPLVLEMA
jgi:hypothetical protein